MEGKYTERLNEMRTNLLDLLPMLADAAVGIKSIERFLSSNEDELSEKISGVQNEIEFYDETRKKVTNILDRERAILDDILGDVLLELVTTNSDET